MGRPSKRTQNKKEAIKISRENIVLHLEELEKDKLRKLLSRASDDIVATNQRKLLNLKSTIKRLKDPVLKKANQIASRKNRSQRLQDPDFKKANQIASRKSMLKRLQDPDIKKANQITSRKSKLKRLQDPRRLPSDSSLCQNVSTKKKTPNSISYKKRERQKLNETRQKKDVLISEYILKRSQGLSEKCYSCHRLRFPSSVNKCNSDTFNRLEMSIPSDAKSTLTICTSCHPHLKKSKVPPLYIGNGYELNSVPSSVTQLNQIEKQMVSLRLPFMKIFKCLRSDGFLIKGNVINVPIDLTKTTSILPRRAENLAAVKTQLTLAHVSETTKSLENTSDHESEETDDEDTNIEPIDSGSTDTMIENCDFVSFAPGEGMKPLSILIDDHAEEKAFPDLFGGNPRTNKSPLKNYPKVILYKLGYSKTLSDDTVLKPNKYIHKRKIRKIIRYVRFNKDKNEQDFYRENIMLYLTWRNEKTDLLDINCKQVYETNINQIKKLYQQFNKVEETQLEDNEIQIEGEQGLNNNQLVDDEDWVPDDVLINDVGDYVENTNTSDVDSPKDDGKIIVHLIDNEQFKDLIGCPNDGQRQLLYHTTNVIRSQLWGKGHPAMKVFVTGPAGAGKPDIDDLSLPPALLTAPTGKAAYGIKGLTLHSAFKLPLNQFAGFDSSSDPSLEDILQKLSIKDVNEYKSIIRTVIRQPTQSNMDIQFILDVYSCVRYVIEYIGKSQRGISKLMRDIVKNLKSSSDLSVKEQLKKIVSIFSGSQEISAQEAVYTCLGMKQCNTSTGYIFINTSHPDKRTRMLKPTAVRGEMDPKSDDIFFDGLNEYYSCRLHSLEDVTLAEFGSNYEVRVYETNIDQIKKLYQPFNKVEETKLDDNEIQIEGEQGRNNNHLVDDEDWVLDDVLINDVGDYVENTNTSDKSIMGKRSSCDEGICHWTRGAEKSMLIRALAQSVIRIANLRPDIDDLSLPPVLLTAPTDKAAYGIKGLTRHSAFKLPLNQFAGLLPKLSSDISNTLRCQFANVKLLIIDEISMVGIKTLGYIDQRLRSILRINKPFGDINVIVFGDFFQLAPVLATPLYDSFEEILTKFPSVVEMLSIKSIWETFKFYELTKIMRQKDDKQFAIMLTKLARGQLEEADVKYFQNLIT
ncbi:ELKS/Rab6-interacting/CAST family member 1-like, partial [Aphis craccivora]